MLGCHALTFRLLWWRLGMCQLRWCSMHAPPTTQGARTLVAWTKSTSGNQPLQAAAFMHNFMRMMHARGFMECWMSVHLGPGSGATRHVSRVSSILQQIFALL